MRTLWCRLTAMGCLGCVGQADRRCLVDVGAARRRRGWWCRSSWGTGAPSGQLRPCDFLARQVFGESAGGRCDRRRERDHSPFLRVSCRGSVTWRFNATHAPRDCRRCDVIGSVGVRFSGWCRTKCRRARARVVSSSTVSARHARAALDEAVRIDLTRLGSAACVARVRGDVHTSRRLLRCHPCRSSVRDARDRAGSSGVVGVGRAMIGAGLAIASPAVAAACDEMSRVIAASAGRRCPAPPSGSSR